jgi:hypothetical protein
MTTAQKIAVFMILLIAGAGVVLTAGAAALALVIWLGAWTLAVEAARLDALALGLLVCLVIVGGVIIVLAIGGPLKKIRLAFGTASAEVEGDE